MLFVLHACKRDNRIGFDLIEGDEIRSAADTLYNLRTWPIGNDTIRTDNTGFVTLGFVQDPVFGSTQSEVALQVNLSGAIPFKVLDSVLVDGTNQYSYFYHAFGKNPKVDSMFLFLAYDTAAQARNTILGDDQATQNLQLRLLADTLPKDLYGFQALQPYLSNTQLATYAHQYSPANEKLSIRIQNQAYVDSFLNNNTVAFASKLAFRDWKLKGLALLNADQNPSFITRYDLSNAETKLRIYYHNDSTLRKDTLVYYDFRVDINSPRANALTRYYSHIQHRYEQAEFAAQLDNPSATGTQKLYIQALGGVRSLIDLSSIAQWPKANSVLVRNAQLVLRPVQADYTTLFPEIEKLSIYRLDANRIMQVVPEYLDVANSLYYSEAYDQVDNEYRFDITSQVQRIVNNQTEGDLGLVLVSEGRFFALGRNTLHAANTPQAAYRMFVKIVYSEGN